jgi:hypothetical protein
MIKTYRLTTFANNEQRLSTEISGHVFIGSNDLSIAGSIGTYMAQPSQA